MSTQEPQQPAVDDTILVFESAPGVVDHRFCTEAEAMDRMRQAKDRNSGGSAFVSKEIPADLAYSLSPELRDRVEAAKHKLRGDIEIRDALDRNGVPADPALRRAIYQSIRELREGWLRRIH